VQLVAKIFNLRDPDPSTSQADRRTICIIVHCAVKTVLTKFTSQKHITFTVLT